MSHPNVSSLYKITRQNKAVGWAVSGLRLPNQTTTSETVLQKGSKPYRKESRLCWLFCPLAPPRPSSTGTRPSRTFQSSYRDQDPGIEDFLLLVSATLPSPDCSMETHGWLLEMPLKSPLFKCTSSLPNRFGTWCMSCNTSQLDCVENLCLKSLPKVLSFMPKLLLWPDLRQDLFLLLVHLYCHLLRIT